RGREKLDCGRGGQRLARYERNEPLAESTIADLVVILQEVDEGERRQMGARLAAWCFAERRILALIGETLRQRAAEAIDRRRGVIAVIAIRFAGQHDMHGVMEIVIPLRVVIARLAASRAFEKVSLVLVVP